MMILFPLTFLSLIAHAIVRIVAGITLILFGVRRLKERNLAFNPRTIALFGGAEVILGLMLVGGFLTQIAAIGTILLSIIALILMRRGDLDTAGSAYYALLIAISLSLFITGAGAFAVDLPF